MTEEVIEEVIDAPKVDFYLRLSAASDMPTVLADFYRQDYVTNVDEEGVETQRTLHPVRGPSQGETP